MPDTRSEFAGLIDRYATAEGIQPTAIPRVFLLRRSSPTEPLHALHEPALCIVAQGRKRTMLANEVFLYDRHKYLVVSVDVPIVGQIIEASAEEPFLCLRLDLDRTTLGSLLLDAPSDGERPGMHTPAPALSLSAVTPDLLDAVVRLLRLLDTPQDIPALAPLIEREILFRLLQGDQTAKLREIATADSRLQQINRAIGFIKRNYRQPMRIEDLAIEARMSASALHSHFKSVTAMSPLQYQKQLRLQEARQLMLLGTCDAATASHRVGYSSPSQFSREYRRLFGAPPQVDIARLKELPEGFVVA